MIPFYRSYLLNQTIHLDKLRDLPLRDLELLNVETLAALNETRQHYGTLDNKDTDEASGTYRRMKIAGYFQAAIAIELANR